MSYSDNEVGYEEHTSIRAVRGIRRSPSTCARRPSSTATSAPTSRKSATTTSTASSSIASTISTICVHTRTVFSTHESSDRLNDPFEVRPCPGIHLTILLDTLFHHVLFRASALAYFDHHLFRLPKDKYQFNKSHGGHMHGPLALVDACSSS